MKFIHTDLGNLDKGRIVEIVLKGNAANVQLLDSTNFNNYKNGRRYHYTGGLAKQSPVRLAVPHSGHWHVAIDMNGLRGTVNAPIPDLIDKKECDKIERKRRVWNERTKT